MKLVFINAFLIKFTNAFCDKLILNDFKTYILTSQNYNLLCDPTLNFLKKGIN